VCASNVTHTIRYLIAGRVQGVYYRAATAARAHELRLRGSVRNLLDGRVEVIAAGDYAAQLELAAWLWRGPPAARVDAVQIEEWLESVEEGFVVVR
jgi:acylphosphatase